MVTAKVVRKLAGCLAIFCAAPAFGWGEQGHSLVNVAAANLMESNGAAFFQANAKNLAKLATTPDVLWKKKATYADEAPMHFFQWDNYQTSRLGDTLDKVVFSQVVGKLGAAYVKKNGSSIWRVDQLYVLMVKALKAGDWTTALQMGGVLGHYVGDLSQPMHDTADYDGQSIGRRGIHAYFETQLVKTMDQGALGDTVVNAGGPLRQSLDQTFGNSTAAGDQLVRTMVLQEGQAAYGDLAPLLGDFSADGQDDEALKGFFGPHMGAGAATLAKIWDLAMVESGATDLPSSAIRVSEPDWMPLQDPDASNNN